MKRKIFLFIATSFFLTSCHKIGLNDILRTDIYGNIVGRGSSQDWIPATTIGNSEASADIDILQFSLNESSSLFGYQKFLVKKDCSKLPDTIEIYPYANPIHNTQDLMIRIRSSIPICFIYYSYEGIKFGSGGGNSTVWSTKNWEEGKKSLDFSISGLAFPTSDMKLKFYVVTTDSCAFRASGTVLVQ